MLQRTCALPVDRCDTIGTCNRFRNYYIIVRLARSSVWQIASNRDEHLRKHWKETSWKKTCRQGCNYTQARAQKWRVERKSDLSAKNARGTDTWSRVYAPFPLHWRMVDYGIYKELFFFALKRTDARIFIVFPLELENGFFKGNFSDLAAFLAQCHRKD